MGITSRQKRPLNRSIPQLRDTRLIIIATEGTKTEKQYFESEWFQSHHVQVVILETTNCRSAPSHVLKRLKEYAANKELWPEDQLWLMVDKDRWPDELLSIVCSQAIRGRRRNASIAVSNPSFELWLFLHLSDWTDGQISSGKMEEKLRDFLGGYNKSNIDMSRFGPGIGMAIQRAKSMDMQPDARWPKNPGTHVYKVIVEIEKLRRLQFTSSF